MAVDQTIIGRTPHSCPATYVGFWDGIRRIYAGGEEARIRGYSQSAFPSTPPAVAAASDGQVNARRDEFSADVKVLCEQCGGRRFDAETSRPAGAGARWPTLAMNVEDALDFFRTPGAPSAALLRGGADYLTLGQPSPTLSGDKRSASSW